MQPDCKYFHQSKGMLWQHLRLDLLCFNLLVSYLPEVMISFNRLFKYWRSSSYQLIHHYLYVWYVVLVYPKVLSSMYGLTWLCIVTSNTYTGRITLSLYNCISLYYGTKLFYHYFSWIIIQCVDDLTQW